MTSDVLIVDDEKDIRVLIAGVLEDEGYITRQAVDAKTTLDQVRARAPSVVLLDIWLEGSSMDGMELLRTIKHLRPNTQVIMISGHGTIETAVKAMKYGAYEFIEKPFQSDRLVFLVERAIESVALRRENLELRSREGPPEDLIGSSNPIVQLSRTIERVAPTGSRVLITGPAGSGKEIVARLIHRNSKRSEAAFIAVSCASLAPERLHKFLFGDDRNTPSGGVFDQADGGTLLLDEVADMPLETQSRMIRMLQEQRFERAAGQGEVEIDVRVIASTNRDLKEEIRGGRFREELFYRLAVVPLEVPPLSDRTEDIPSLARHFIQVGAITSGMPQRTLSEDAIAALQAHSWPGNVRQLRNVIDWLLIMAPGGVSDSIRADMLPSDLAGETPQLLRLERSDEIMMLPLRGAREMFEREYLMAQVTRCGGNISRTAEFVGMERSALHRKLKALGITTEVKLTRESAEKHAGIEQQSRSRRAGEEQ